MSDEPTVFLSEKWAEETRANWAEAGAIMLAAATEAIRPLAAYCAAVVANFTEPAAPTE